jgi:elongation factor Ts
MNISAGMVKELREKTGAGIMDCKKALKECDGDVEKAAEYLKKKGIADASKKSGRIAAEGTVASYIHMGGKIGVLVEVNCETDFVAKTEDFQALTKNLAMQIAAAKPLYVKREDVPEEVIAKEKEIYKTQALESGKPEKIVDKIASGKMEKYFSEICLLEQKFIRDPDKTVEEIVKETIAKTGENIVVRRFTRYELGEGLEKRSCNLAEEIAKELDK